MTLFDRLVRGIKPYRVRTHPLSKEEIFERCRQVSVRYQELDLASSFLVYQKVVDTLVNNQRIEVRALGRLMESVPDGKVVVSLRHDLDGDIVTGVRAARYLARKGLPGSFYLLHTSHYYGMIENGVFYRFDGLKKFVADFIAAGCEIGLHTDPLLLYCAHKIDGAQAVKAEIKWLRSLGTKISGTVAHNSAPVFGAENFEVFVKKASAGRKAFSYKGKAFPLQRLNEKKLLLTYEGNYPILPARLDASKVAAYIDVAHQPDCVRKADWQRFYFLDNPFFARRYEVDIWLLAQDKWLIANRSRGGELLWPVNTQEMLEYLDGLDHKTRIVISVHPEYVSA